MIKVSRGHENISKVLKLNVPRLQYNKKECVKKDMLVIIVTLIGLKTNVPRL